MRSDCPISYALDFFGDKWTLLIIRDLVFHDKKFYKDFLQSKEGIATNILADRLKKLEANGVVESAVYPESKNKKEYKLTQKGKALIPVLVEMIVWSAGQENGLAVTKKFLSKVKADRAEVIATIRSNLD